MLSIGLAIDVKTHCPAAAVQNRGFPTFGDFLQTSRAKPLFFSGAKLMLVSGRLLLGDDQAGSFDLSPLNMLWMVMNSTGKKP